jgi:Mg2+/Co2+ transporter CorC
MDIALPTEDADTLAGLVFTQLGKVPEVGEVATFPEADIEVLALSGRRIRRVRVLRRPARGREEDSSADTPVGARSDHAAERSPDGSESDRDS